MYIMDFDLEGTCSASGSFELSSDITDSLLSDDTIMSIDLDPDERHQSECCSDGQYAELEFDISTESEYTSGTDEESDLESDAQSTNGADLLPFESHPTVEDDEWKQPLYTGAKITKFDSFLLLVQFMLR